jgi:D,D-heptose 1,7-bisphosphate phosphatase
MRMIFSENHGDTARPAIFIDRDGVINYRIVNGYVLQWSQFVFISGVRESLRRLAELQLPLIVISNQAAVGRGLLHPAELETITSRMYEILLEDGVSLSAVYYCTHRPDECCDCRKPRPNLLYQAAADFTIDLDRSIFIGDSESDVQAARSANCQPILFGHTPCTDLDLPDWMTSVHLAPTTADLFQVAADCLRAAASCAHGPREAQSTHARTLP